MLGTSAFAPAVVSAPRCISALGFSTSVALPSGRYPACDRRLNPIRGQMRPVTTTGSRTEPPVPTHISTSRHSRCQTWNRRYQQTCNAPRKSVPGREREHGLYFPFAFYSVNLAGRLLCKRPARAASAVNVLTYKIFPFSALAKNPKRLHFVDALFSGYNPPDIFFPKMRMQHINRRYGTTGTAVYNGGSLSPCVLCDLPAGIAAQRVCK